MMHSKKDKSPSGWDIVDFDSFDRPRQAYNLCTYEGDEAEAIREHCRWKIRSLEAQRDVSVRHQDTLKGVAGNRHNTERAAFFTNQIRALVYLLGVKFEHAKEGE